jgi:hypothetical protein
MANRNPIQSGSDVFDHIEDDCGFIRDDMRSAINIALGYQICGSIGWDGCDNPTICIQRAGVEHDHG